MNKKPVNGMRDIMPREMEIRDYVISLVKETYKSFGFTPMETPVVESIENLSSKQGGENEKLIFKIMKRGEKLDLSRAVSENDLADSGLRYDLTVPLSRYYANHQAELPKPFKALQIGPVFRAERPQKGRYREFYQCDIDIFGEAGNLAEIELILATTTLLSKVGFHDFKIRINDRRILRAMGRFAGIPEEQFDGVCIILDKMDKIGAEGVKQELLDSGIPEESAERYLDLFKENGGLSGEEAVRAFCRSLGEALESGVEENMTEIFRTVGLVSEIPFTLEFDPTLVRGMGYYTGPIFEIAVPEFGSSVGGGGRYDEMSGRFAGQKTPACGFSIGFERIISILCDQDFQVPGGSGKCAFLMEKSLPEEKKAEVLKKAADLRKEGKQVLTVLMAKNRKFQKDQLRAEGYSEITEVFRDPIE